MWIQSIKVYLTYKHILLYMIANKSLYKLSPHRIDQRIKYMKRARTITLYNVLYTNYLKRVKIKNDLFFSYKRRC